MALLDSQQDVRLFGIATFFVIAFALAWRGLTKREARNWPRIPAKIRGKKVVSDGESRYPALVLEYPVGESLYLKELPVPAKLSRPLATCEQILEEIPNSREVVLSVNPRRPSQVFTDPDDTFWEEFLAIPAFGAALILLVDFLIS